MIYTVWTDNKIHCQRLNDKINDPDYVILDNNLYTEQELMEVLSKCKRLLILNFMQMLYRKQLEFQLYH